MPDFDTVWLAQRPTSIAPDGSAVRTLIDLKRGGMAHFELPPGRVSRAVRHRTVEEIWFFVAGSGEMWRRQGEREETVAVRVGCCISIPVGTSFQFRAVGLAPLAAVGVTMPPWPGDREVEFIDGAPGWKYGASTRQTHPEPLLPSGTLRTDRAGTEGSPY